MYSNSLVGSIGKASIVDFDKMSSSIRTSIVKNIHRKTEVLSKNRLRDSEASFNDRCSKLDEGSANSAQPSINKYSSAVESAEFNCSVIRETLNESQNSGSNSGRKYAAVKSFVCPNDEDGFEGPFSSKPTDKAEENKTSDNLKNSVLEDCEVVENDEQYAQAIPSQR